MTDDFLVIIGAFNILDKACVIRHQLKSIGSFFVYFEVCLAYARHMHILEIEIEIELKIEIEIEIEIEIKFELKYSFTLIRSCDIIYLTNFKSIYERGIK